MYWQTVAVALIIDVRCLWTDHWYGTSDSGSDLTAWLFTLALYSSGSHWGVIVLCSSLVPSNTLRNSVFWLFFQQHLIPIWSIWQVIYSFLCWILFCQPVFPNSFFQLWQESPARSAVLVQSALCFDQCDDLHWMRYKDCFKCGYCHLLAVCVCMLLQPRRIYGMNKHTPTVRDREEFIRLHC